MVQFVVDRIMTSKNVHMRNPQPRNTLPLHGKGTLQMGLRIQILKVGSICKNDPLLVLWLRREGAREQGEERECSSCGLSQEEDMACLILINQGVPGR